MRHPFSLKRVIQVGALALGLALQAPIVWGEETDNFHLPLEPEFADFGPFLEAVHTRAIEDGVRLMNSRIEGSLNLKDPQIRARKLAEARWPDALVAAVARQFGDAPTEVVRIQRTVSGRWAQRTFPQSTLIHHDIVMNLRGHLPVDPRVLVMLRQAGTIKAFGVYFGTDKLVHLHQLGYGYYLRYRNQLRKGTDPETAMRDVIEHFSGDGFLAEGHLFGTMGTGVYSNADMASNYAGFKFFLNLTEETSWLGQKHPPLVVRCGTFWRVNDHVRPGSGWFRAFITDHWNEALNPSLYDPTMRRRIHRTLVARAAPIVDFYTRRDGRPNNSDYYETLAHSLATYGGEPYGHSGRFDKLMHLGNTCLPAVK